MKIDRLRTFYIALSFLTLIAFSANASRTADGRMYCLSLRVSQGTNIYGDTMSLNSTGMPEGAGELSPVTPPAEVTFPHPPEFYASNLYVDEEYSGEPWTGITYLDLPNLVDADNNRYPDFFEVSKSISTTSLGSWSLRSAWFGDQMSGNMQITWARNANSPTGTVWFAFDNGVYWATFRHNFEILEYRGPISYTPGTNVVTATVDLTQTGQPAVKWFGPINFVKHPTDPANQLTNLPTFWTNAAAQARFVTNHLHFRQSAWPDNYAGYIHFDDDADPWSPHPWAFWVLSVTDYNDTNQDGIPDFSDIPQPRRPHLMLTRNTGQLQLTIRGEVGYPHQVLQSPSLSGPWQTNTTIDLVSDPQTIDLPTPSENRYYRVRVQ